MSLLRRTPKIQYRYLPPQASSFMRRQREDATGLSRWARSRDRDAILDELKADEEPDYIPIRKRVEVSMPTRPQPVTIKGWDFVAKVRDKNITARLPQGVLEIWNEIELDFDYENLAPTGFMYLDAEGTIKIQPNAEDTPSNWQYYMAHLVFHVAYGLLSPPPNHPNPNLWCYAAEVLVNRATSAVPSLKVPAGFPVYNRSRFGFFRFGPQTPPPQTPEEQILEWEQAAQNKQRLPNFLQWRTPRGEQTWDVVETTPEAIKRYRGIYLHSIVSKLEVKRKNREDVISRAYRWVEDQFPLLSSVTREFRLDYESAAKYKIALGAVAAQEQVIFVNPEATLSELEWRWVLVHEILHVVLEHHKRLNERDPLLWNVACDYVINNWLETMGVGMRPEGVLYKRDYAGRDSESIYDELLKNGGNEQLKVLTFRGMGLSDILDFDQEYQNERGKDNLGRRFRPNVRNVTQGNAKRMMEKGEHSKGRYPGDLPADLVEELDLKNTSSEQVEIPQWKTELAQWLDLQLTPSILARSFARPSRRQSTTPEIPLPGKAKVGLHSPTFGVILDTSGSMSHELLQKGLSAVVAFSERHGVRLVRLVMCDTRPYDEGFIPLEDLKRSFRVYGRGGTVLQPSVDLLEEAEDFPDDAPLLIVTDGAIDILNVHRAHAFLLPGDGKLPFEPEGPVFRILGENNGSPFGRRFPPPSNNS